MAAIVPRITKLPGYTKLPKLKDVKGGTRLTPTVPRVIGGTVLPKLPDVSGFSRLPPKPLKVTGGTALPAHLKEGMLRADVTPDPEGGWKVKGELTESQRKLLEQVGNIHAILMTPNPEWFRQRNLPVQRSFDHILKQQLWTVTPNERDKAVMNLVHLLGIPRGNPLINLMMEAAAGRDELNPPNYRRLDPAERARLTMERFKVANMKLGIDEGGKLPDWALNEQWLADPEHRAPSEPGHFELEGEPREVGKFYSNRTANDRGYDEDLLSYLSHQTGERQANLQRIIETMRRREMGT